MILKMFSIRDSKSEIYLPPFYAKAHGEAERNFHQLTNDEKSNVHNYPQDYDLYYLGEYDDQTGKMQSLNTPQHVAKAAEMLTTKQ